MPSTAPSRLTVALSLAVVAALALTIGFRNDDRPADIELGRAAIIEPEAGDVVAAAAPVEPEVAPAPATTAPPTTQPPTTTTAPAPPTTEATAAPRPAPTTAPAPAPAPTAPPTTSAPAPAPSATPTASTRSTSCESSMLRWMNEARASRGIRALTADSRIYGIALDWTDTMAQRQDLGHNPEYAQQIFSARPEAATAGENVGRGTGTERGLFDAFMGSPSHRDKILGSQYSHATVACTTDAGGQLWVTQNFWG